MIRRLRARHRAIFVLLALTLPAGFALALAQRRGPPPARTSEPPSFGREVRWPELDLLLGLRYDAARRLELRVTGGNGPRAPALLVYWSPVEATGGALPSAARLLGPLGTLPRELALDDVEPRGWLVLYSLGHAEVLGQRELVLEREL